MSVSGKVKIEVIITPDGHVKSTRVIGGHPLLVQSCQDAVKEWKFFRLHRKRPRRLWNLSFTASGQLGESQRGRSGFSFKSRRPVCGVEAFCNDDRQETLHGFGSILAILVGLFLVNIIAGMREQSARSDATAALDSVRTIESVRYQIMLNRHNLNNFLLSGDPRDEEKVNKGLTDIADLIKRGEAQTSNDSFNTALIQVESTEASWADNFAKPLLAKRHQVDSGDATVSDLQIFYLQKDPASWLVKSSSVLDQTSSEITEVLDETQQVCEHAPAPSAGGHDLRHAPRSCFGDSASPTTPRSPSPSR